MKCFYHSSDLDGHCSGAIIKYKHPECEMIGINYGDEIDWDSIQPGEIVFMVDFSLPIKDMFKLDRMSQLIWIDHHNIAIEEAHRVGFIAGKAQILDENFAGCELTWDYLFGKVHPEYRPTPLTVTLLGRYDVRDHQDDRVLPFQYGMRINEDTRPDVDYLWKPLFDELEDNEPFDTPCLSIIETGKTILTYEKIQNEKFVKAFSFTSQIDGYTAIAVNKGFTNSKLFDVVWDPEKHDVMLTFCWRGGKWNYSLYSIPEKNIHCGKIAQKFGGGGHPYAAGFNTEQLILSKGGECL